MRIPKGFIKDSEGIYRRGNFVFKDNKIFRESSIVPKSTIEDLADNYTTAAECIRSVLSYSTTIGEKPRTTDVYIDKVGDSFKSSNKFSKNTVAIVTSDRNVVEIKTKDISNADDFSDLINKSKEDKPVKAKEIRKFSSDKPKDSQEVIRAGLKESVENTEDFRRNFSSNLVNYINKSLSFSANNKKEDLKKLDDIISSFKDEIDMINNDFVEYINTNLNESEKLKESTKFYNTEEPDVYIEVDNGKVVANPAGKVLDVTPLGLVQNGDTVYVVTSDNDYNTIYAYSVDYTFPYEFKYTQEK